MGDRCYSTLICSERDKDLFEKMGFRLEESKALSADGVEIPGAVVMVDEQASNGSPEEVHQKNAPTHNAVLDANFHDIQDIQS